MASENESDAELDENYYTFLNLPKDVSAAMSSPYNAGSINLIVYFRRRSSKLTPPTESRVAFIILTNTWSLTAKKRLKSCSIV